MIGVDSRRQRVITHDRSEVAYDHLLLCVGARKLASIWGAETFWGVNDEGGVVAVLGRLRRGELHRLVFAITAASWPLPLYELALLAEAELTQLGRKEDVTLTIVTPEDAPLGLFGVRVGERLRELLAERGIELLTGTYPVKVEGGFLQITPGDVLAADAVISTPRLEGHRLEGVPTNASGFVEVDEFS